MKVLVINTGSSSIKYQLFDMRDAAVLAVGLLERISEPASTLTHQTRTGTGEMASTRSEARIANHRDGLRRIVDAFSKSNLLRPSDERDGLLGIGHRVVHGGEAFKCPCLIDDDVVSEIRRCIPLAPLHNSANLVGIEVALDLFPEVPQVAVFDTAFHQSLPPHAYHYAFFYELYSEHGVRRYGFHGTSHHYVAKQAATFLDTPLESLNLIVLHLGNGAIEGGKSIDTSMGLTPLEGLVMGTRSGDLDPAIVFHLCRITGRPEGEIESLLNKESGLQGLCGANDMREVLGRVESGDAKARLALQIYCYRIKKFIGAYAAALGRVDAVVFTAGIGENAAPVRKLACEGLAALGIEIDSEKNNASVRGSRAIQSGESGVKVLVIPTDEELEIARQTMEQVQALQTA